MQELRRTHVRCPSGQPNADAAIVFSMPARVQRLNVCESLVSQCRVNLKGPWLTDGGMRTILGTLA
jgi:hypothetical protein